MRLGAVAVGGGDVSIQQSVNRRNWRHGHTYMDAHGKVHVSPTWGSWRAMRRRAGKKAGYEHVKVCARWAKFANFLADMGERPPGMTLDRKDNAKGYTPSNCRWATPKQQAWNRNNDHPRDASTGRYL